MRILSLPASKPAICPAPESSRDWPRAAIALTSPIPLGNELVVILYGRDAMREWMAEHARWQVDTVEWINLHIRWRHAQAPTHAVEYVESADWNAGERWPRFSSWLYSCGGSC